MVLTTANEDEEDDHMADNHEILVNEEHRDSHAGEPDDAGIEEAQES